MKHTRLAALALVLLPLAAAVSGSEPSVGPEVAVALDNANRRFSEAWVRGDIDAIVSAYAPGATVQPPAGGILKSLAAVRGVFEPILRWDRVAHRLEPTLREPLGPDRVLEMGRWHSSRKDGDAVSASSGCYTVIWERTASLEWKMRFDAWGSPNDASWACRPRS